MTYTLWIGISFWETTKTSGKWHRSVGNGSNMGRYDLIIWQTAEKCGKWLLDSGNGQNNWEMA